MDIVAEAIVAAHEAERAGIEDLAGDAEADLFEGASPRHGDRHIAARHLKVRHHIVFKLAPDAAGPERLHGDRLKQVIGSDAHADAADHC